MQIVNAFKDPGFGISASAYTGTLLILSGYNVFSNDIAADDMLFHNPPGSFGIHFAIGNFGLIANHHLNDGFFFTQANAAGLGDDHPVNIFFFDDFQDGFHRIARTGGNTAGAHANDHLRLAGGGFDPAFFKSFFTQFL